MIGKPPSLSVLQARDDTFAPPSAFGIPPKFDAWRPGQVPAILDVLDTDKRFFCMAAPTGFGKSLAYTSIAAIRGGRTCILTSTKGLQSQLVQDFAEMGMVDIRGQSNYQCIAAPSFGYAASTMCSDGPCHSGVKCDLKEAGCLYYDQYRRTLASNFVVTNYSYWLYINRYGEGLGNFDTLILDEAHDAPDELASFLGVELDSSETVECGLGECPHPGTNVKEWAEWAKWAGDKGAEQLSELAGQIRSIGTADRRLVRLVSKLRKLRGKLATLATMQTDWIVEYIDQRGNRFVPRAAQRTYFKFDPLWPNRYAEQFLFRNIPKVVLVSATVRPKTVSLLGIKDEHCDFREYPSTFPIDRRPVVWVPTVQLSHRSTPSQLREWSNRVYQIIERRADRKGILHTVSYKRAMELYDNAPREIKEIMMVHNSTNTRGTIEAFKRNTHPCILVSPSITTGYDFPYDQCEYQIICKLPFPDNRAAIIKARMTEDKEYSNYTTMQVLVQSTGRGMRAEDDKCETLIVDDNIKWFIWSNKKHAPQWWLDSYRASPTIPQPLTKL